MEKQNLIRVYLDDERQTPPGWTRVYWPSEAIALLETGRVQEISLDHDLGDDARGTGYDVVLWIEEAVALRSFQPPKMVVHSANSSAREKMIAGIQTIERMHEAQITGASNQPRLEPMETSMGTHSLTREQRAQRGDKVELTHRVEHILRTEWDPIGVQWMEGSDCLDEYDGYVPALVEMLIAGASQTEISDQLMEFEDDMLGGKSARRRCDVIAVMLSSYGPHYLTNPFTPTVNTDTPENAYLSVLDLVTQTRLDAYRRRWDEVRKGYEQAIDICLAHLSDRDELIGACMHNLGNAYYMLDQTDQAQTAFKNALSRLAKANPTLVSLNEERISVEGDGYGPMPNIHIID